MGYLNNKLSGIAAVLEETTMEKMALTREQKKELTRSRRKANIAGRKANKNVADVMHKADDLLGGKKLQAAAQIASQQEALANGIAGGASGWKSIMDDALQSVIQERHQIAGYLNRANGRIVDLSGQLNNANLRIGDLGKEILGKTQALDAAEAGRLRALDDLVNFKNLGRFANAAKWIKGNPKKSIGAAVLGGAGLFGGGVGSGYLLKDYLDSREEQ